MSRVWKSAAFVLLIAALTAYNGNHLNAEVTNLAGVQSSASDKLPKPQTRGKRSLEEVLATRRSVRDFTTKQLSDAEISQLLWAAQGISDSAGHRTTPSAGALYPLEIYVAKTTGLYHYKPAGHELVRRDETDLRQAIQQAALGQDAITKAPAVFVITAVYARTEIKYGRRAERYTHMEAGHAAQNLLLQAVALELAGVPIGAFRDDQLKTALRLPNNETPLYVIPVGHPR